MLSAEDRALFLEEFGGNVPVTLNGALVTTIKGIPQYEEIVSSPNEAELGSSVLTLQLDRDVYASLDKSKKYGFTVEGTLYMRRGPATQDGSGFMKLQLTEYK